MKILLVDDALDMRLVMRRTLMLMGHEVTVAEDGEVAWDILQQESFQVVITDWVMPRLDGPGLCRRIRESYFSHYLYIIMLTGLSGKPNLIAGMDAGADDFTNKPIERDEVEVLLRAAGRVISLESKLEQQNQSLEAANRILQQTQDDVQRDLRHAAVLQKGILPAQGQLGQLDFAWFYRPASFIGGDTFNYFPLDEEVCLFYTADVSGHGISSALLSMYLSNLLTSASNGAKQNLQSDDNAAVGYALGQLVASFNEHLQDVLDFSGHYFTMILGVINTRKQQLHFVQAGHPKPFMVKTGAAQVTELDCTGFPVGLIPQAEYEAVNFDFTPGSRLALFSDGAFELTKPGSDEALYSADDLAAELHGSACLPAAEAVKLICNRWLLNESVVDECAMNECVANDRVTSDRIVNKSAAEETIELPDDLSLLLIDFKA